jgi:hypothetical protein
MPGHHDWTFDRREVGGGAVSGNLPPALLWTARKCALTSAAHASTANFGMYSARSVFPRTVGQLAWETVLPVLRNYTGQMPGLADCGYEDAGHGIFTPVKKPRA